MDSPGIWTVAPGQLASSPKVLLPVRQSHQSDKMLSLLSKVIVCDATRKRTTFQQSPR